MLTITAQQNKNYYIPPQIYSAAEYIAERTRDNVKKWFSVILSAVLLFGSTAPIINAQDTGTAVSDEELTEYVAPEQKNTGKPEDEEIPFDEQEIFTAELGADDEMTLFADYEIPPGGYLTQTDFEDQKPEPFTYADASFVNDTAPETGSTMKVGGSSGTTTIYAMFDPTYLVDQGSNPALDAKTREGADCSAITEFDVKFDDLVQKKTNLELRLCYSESSDVNTYIHRVQFNGNTQRIEMYDNSIKSFVGSANDTPRIVDGRWYRVRIVVHATRPSGSALKKVSVYLDDTAAFEQMSFLSTTATKVAAYDKLIMTGLAQTTAYIDNFSVFKVNTNTPEIPLYKGNLISAARQAWSMYENAPQGDGEDEYDAELCSDFYNAVINAADVYNNADEQQTLDDAAEELYEYMDSFVPNGRPIKINSVDYCTEDGTSEVGSLSETDRLNVKVSILADKKSAEMNNVMVVSALYDKDSSFGYGRPIQIAASDVTVLARNEARDISAFLDLSGYADRSGLFVKTMVWSGADSPAVIMPQAVTGFNENPGVPAVAHDFSGNANVEKTVIDDDNIKYNVTVRTEPGSEVIFELLNTGRDYDALSSVTSDTFDSVLNYADQTTADDEGYAAFEFIPTSGGGEYKYRITSVYEVIDDKFEYYMIGSIKTALSSICNAASVSAFTGNIKEYSAILDLNDSVLKYALENGINLEYAYSVIKSGVYDYTTLDIFKNDLYKSAAVCVINQCGKEEFISFVNPRSDVSAAKLLGFTEQTGSDLKRYESLINGNTDLKGGTADIFIANRDYTLDNVLAGLNESIFLGAVVSAKTSDMVHNALTENSDLFVNTGYSNLSAADKIKAAQAVYKYRSQVKGQESFNTVLTKSVNEVKQAAGAGGSASGGGGSGSGSGGSSGGKVSSVAPSNTNVAASQTTPIEKVESAVNFSDIESVEWAKEAINVLCARGVVSGRGDGIFDPDALVTREEFMKMLISMFGLLDNTASTDFSDVRSGDWFYQYVASAEKHGIVKGIDETSFGTGRSLTREDLAVLICRAAQTANLKFDNYGEYMAFDDDEDISDYAKEAVETLTKNGIINGMGNNKFVPKKACTRAEAVKMLYSTELLVSGS